MKTRPLKDRPYAKKFTDASRTEQAHANDVDINQIMARARRGQMPVYSNANEARYGDATPIQLFEAQQIIANANSLFEELPAKLRSRFNNDPAQLLQFVQNPDNLEESYKLKLRKRPIPAEPPVPAVVPEPPSKNEPSPPPQP